mgnify:CR=1 FL=1
MPKCQQCAQRDASLFSSPFFGNPPQLLCPRCYYRQDSCDHLSTVNFPGTPYRACLSCNLVRKVTPEASPFLEGIDTDIQLVRDSRGNIWIAVSSPLETLGQGQIGPRER